MAVNLLTVPSANVICAFAPFSLAGSGVNVNGLLTVGEIFTPAKVTSADTPSGTKIRSVVAVFTSLFVNVNGVLVSIVTTPFS